MGLKPLVLVLGVIVLISGCVQEARQAPEGFRTYANPVYGVSVFYPEDWTPMEVPEEGYVAFVTPEYASIIIYTEILYEPLTLDELLDRIGISDLYEIYNVTESGPYTFLGNPAHKVEYIIVEEGVKAMQVWGMKNNRACSVTYTAEMDDFSRVLGSVEEMMDSIELI